MSDAQTAYQELVKAAQELSNRHWVETGHSPPQENTMLATLWLELKNLRADLAAQFCRHGEGFACSLCKNKPQETLK